MNHNAIVDGSWQDDPHVIRSLMNFSWRNSEIIGAISQVPQDWIDSWYLRFGKQTIDDYLARLGSIGGQFYHSGFSRVSLAQSEETKLRAAIELSNSLNTLCVEVTKTFSVDNHCWAFLLMLSGLSISTLTIWDSWNMADAIIPRQQHVPINVITTMIEHSIDMQLLESVQTGSTS